MIYYFAQQKIMTRETVQEAMLSLPANFLQIHKSYIINTGFIVSFDKQEVNPGKIKLPVSDPCKGTLFDFLKG